MKYKQHLGATFDNLLIFLNPPTKSQWSSIASEIKGGDTLLDLGCGEGNHLGPVLDQNETVRITGIDSHQASLEIAEAKNRYEATICGDIFDELKKLHDSSYDVVIACDLIEHLDVLNGEKLMFEMRRVSKRISIIATPNGYVPQPPRQDNPANEHISGWEKNDFAKFGYSVTSGHYGLKWLRGTYGLPRVRPMQLGELLASITVRPLSLLPNLNFQIVAVARKPSAIE